MERKLSKKLRKYYRTIRSLLICDKTEKDKILSDLKSDIDAKIDEGAVKSMKDVTDIFGFPDDIASDYQGKDVTSLRNIRRIIIKSIIAVVLILILIAVLYVVIILIINIAKGTYYMKIDFTVD